MRAARRVAARGALTVAPDIVERRAQFVQQSLTADVSNLSAGDRQALEHLVAAIEGLTDLPVDVDPSCPLEGLR